MLFLLLGDFQLAWLVVFLLFFQFWIFWPIWPLCCVLYPFKACIPLEIALSICMWTVNIGINVWEDLWNETYELCICLSLELIHWVTETICNDCPTCLQKSLKKPSIGTQPCPLNQSWNTSGIHPELTPYHNDTNNETITSVFQKTF